MLTKVAIKNFKSLRDVQIDLERFTVFVGPNASGKTSILQSLELLCLLYRIEFPQQLNPQFIPYRTRGVTDPIEFVTQVGGTWFRYRTPDAKPDPMYPERWKGDGCGTAKGSPPLRWQPWQKRTTEPYPLPTSVLMQLETSKLISPAPNSADPTSMAPNGSGLHTALASMALNDPDSWQALQADLRRIVPAIRRLRHTKQFLGDQPASLLFDSIGGDSLPADQVSEGTLLVLGLLAALHAPTRPNLILLDDLDRGLHPKAQRELVGLLRGVLESNPDLQIVATTHSPYLLGRMEPSEVRMTHLNDAGATGCDSLTHHPKFPKWKDEMSAGEMWSLFGEKWVVGQEVPA